MNNHIFRIEKRIHTYYSINFDYDPDLVSLVRKIPTSEFNPKLKEWTVLESPETVPKIQKLIEEGDFDVTNDVLDSIEKYQLKNQTFLKLSNIGSYDADFSKYNINAELYPLQKAGSHYMVASKRCFNGSEMGAGKTYMALASMEIADAYPHIIVCPNKMKTKWRQKAYEVLPHRTSMILDDNNFYYNYDILILNYEAITKYLIMEKKDPERSTFKIREVIKRLGVKGFTADECHYLKESKSIRTRAIKKLCKDIEYIWMLSGTFVLNKPFDLVSQLQIMRRLNDLGGYNYFIKRYCDKTYSYNGVVDKNGASNLVELNEKLKKTCLVRFKTEDVVKDLPPKTIKKLPIKIDNMEEYELAKNNVFEWVETVKKKGDNPLGVVSKRPDRNLTEDAIELQVINALRYITAKGKLNACIEWIKKFIEKTDKKIVIFAHHKEIQFEVIKNFPRCAKIIGGMTASEQQKNENLFKKDSCKEMVCSMMSAREGLDLVSAHNYIGLEYPWVPAYLDQAEDRLRRIGQHHKVNCYYPIAIDTIDEDIFTLHESKRKISKAIMDGEEYDENRNIKKELVSLLKNKGDINFDLKEYI